MKKIEKSIFIACLACMITACQTAVAQPPVVPTITKAYSNAEIDKMVKEHFRSRSMDVNPPALLKEQLKKDFPNASDIEWEEAANIYEADFEIERMDYKAYYDSKANLLMCVIDIHESEVPAVGKNTAIAKYPDSDIDKDAKKVYKGTNIYYVIELEKDRTERKITLAMDGSIIEEKIKND